MPEKFDAVVVGSGPNGLTSAIVMARAGLSVCVLEARETIGGGARTEEITLPGFHSDICSAIHPIGIVSPIFRVLNIARHGLEWVYPETPLAHPQDDGSVALLRQSLEETGASLGADGKAWHDLMQPFLNSGNAIFEETLRPLRIPQHPFLMARFGLQGLRRCTNFVESKFSGPLARALFTGCAAHSMLPLDAFATASFGMVLALSGHAIGWPCALGGSFSIIRALEFELRELGGVIRVSSPVRSMRDIPDSRVVLFNLTPRQVLSIAGDVLPSGYKKALGNFNYGAGIFKVDWALDGPIPWKSAECLKAATVHVGGTYEEIAQGEWEMSHGTHPEKPFVLVAQQSLFDTTRAPAGKHTGWAYCHVPANSPVDMTERIEQQIERFAPGFRDLILARHTISSGQLEAKNNNMIGGDIGGGENNFRQFLFRPVARWNPYTTPNERLFLCSSSTPPGGGVHGMCGYWAAKAALKKRFGLEAVAFLPD